MVKVAICDDNIDVLNKLKKLIEEKEPKWQVDVFSDGYTLEEQLKKNLYAIYFLDIELGSMDGYELSKEVRKKDASALIIFVSSHSEYACDAFEVDAFRFLRKPIEEEKVFEAIEKAKGIVQTQNYQFHYHYKGNGMDYQVKLANILYFERKQRILPSYPDKAPWYLFSLICLIAVSADWLYFNSTTIAGLQPALALGLNIKSA